MDLVTWAKEAAYEKLAEGLPERFAHAQRVSQRASLVAPLLSAFDGDLLVSAGMLHGIGRAPGLAHTGFHPLDSARFLQKSGAPERLVNLVARQAGASYEAELRGLSAELAIFPDEETTLRDAFWWAHMTTTPEGEKTTVAERIETIKATHGKDHPTAVYIREAHADLTAAATRTEDRLREAGIDFG